MVRHFESAFLSDHRVHGARRLLARMEKISTRLRPLADPEHAEGHSAGFVDVRPEQACATRPADQTSTSKRTTERSADQQDRKADQRPECKAIRGRRELPILEG